MPGKVRADPYSVHMLHGWRLHHLEWGRSGGGGGSGGGSGSGSGKPSQNMGVALQNTSNSWEFFNTVSDVSILYLMCSRVFKEPHCSFIVSCDMIERQD